LKKIYLTAAFILIILLNPLKAQVIPEYKERISAARDSLQAINNFSFQITAGSVNPDEYIIGPGDKFFVSISGIEDINLNLIVNQESILFIPKVGEVNLKKTTLTNSKEKIKAAINRYYKNVEISVSLIDFRKIKAALLGDVVKPSSYVLDGNARLIDLIMNSYGLNETSNYRNVKIISRDNDTVYYDFLSFLRFGKMRENPLLKDGDIVIIDKADEVISIYGEVKYPGIYEFLEGESIYDLIELAGGFLTRAKKDTIEVVSFNNSGRTQYSKYYSLDELKQNHILLKNKDQVMVREKPEYLEDRYVRIEGFVRYPGYYKINKDETTLSEIIEMAGGFRENASLTEATLIRSTGITEADPELERIKLIDRADLTEDEYDYLKAKSRQRPGSVIVNFEDLFIKGDKSEDIILKRGDVIKIPEAKNYIIMLGQVVNPGNIIYNPNYTIEDYIALAGGYSWRAQENDVRVVRAKTGEWVDADDVDFLYPGDTIWIPEDPPAPKFWDVFTTSLTIVGQVASIIAATVAIIVASR